MAFIENTDYLRSNQNWAKHFFFIILLNDMHNGCLDQSYVEMQSYFLSLVLRV